MCIHEQCIEVLRLGNVNHCVLLYWFYNAPGLYGSSVSLAFNERKRVGQFKRCNNTIKYYVKNDIRKSVENQITIRIYQWYTYIDFNVQLSFNRSLLKALFYTRCLNLPERLVNTVYIYIFLNFEIMFWINKMT